MPLVRSIAWEFTMWPGASKGEEASILQRLSVIVCGAHSHQEPRQRQKLRDCLPWSRSCNLNWPSSATGAVSSVRSPSLPAEATPLLAHHAAASSYIAISATERAVRQVREQYTRR